MVIKGKGQGTNVGSFQIENNTNRKNRIKRPQLTHLL